MNSCALQAPLPADTTADDPVHSAWNSADTFPLNRELFSSLLNNRIPFIRIPRFATEDECEKLVVAASKRGFSPYRGVEPRINRIGNTVFEFNNISRDEYFKKNEEACRVQADIFRHSFDPITRFMRLIHDETNFPVRLATRANGEGYFAGLIRRIEDGTLIHIDFAPVEQNGWEVAEVTHQLAWNLYLRTSGENDGRTHIYQRQWRPGDDLYREGIYGYNECVVHGSKAVNFLPEVGEVVIFNTRNFHFVEGTSGERVTVTSALGMLPHNEIIFWS